MSQEYTPVEWVDETPEQMGTLINKARLDQMQSAHHFADGFEEVDAVPTADPGVDYHKIVYCTVDKQFYRWTGSAWEKDIDDDTKALLLAHEADHANPHVVTKAQVGLGNCDNTSDADKPVSTAQQTALDAKVDDTQVVSAWQATPDNAHIPTEKLTKDTIDGVDASAVHKAGAETITGAKTIKADITIGEVGTPTDVTQVGDLNIKGNITIEGNITQNGSAYETHAEKIYTTKDYIYLREGATGALSPGDYTGIEAEKYDGTNNGRLAFDSSGTARVGDVGDEQPLLTRDESADLTNGHLMKWDANNQKAVDSGISTNDIDDALDTKVGKTQYNLDMAGKVSGSGNIGSDTKPVKIVNGQAVAVTDELEKKISSINTASMFFSTASIPVSSQWNRQTAASVTIPANSPYFANDGGKIKVLQAGVYIIVARMSNNISSYEGIEIEGITIFQNGTHNTQIAQIIPLNANNVIAGTLYGGSGSGVFEQYNGLNRIDIIKL